MIAKESGDKISLKKQSSSFINRNRTKINFVQRSENNSEVEAVSVASAIVESTEKCRRRLP